MEPLGTESDLESQEGSVTERKPAWLLSLFLASSEASQADRILEELICSHAEPVIRRICRAKLLRGGSGHRCGPEDEEDLHNTSILQLISRLHTLKRFPSLTQIDDFESYVAGITYNCLNQMLRARTPGRWRLRNRIRYVLNHRPEFRVFCGPSGEVVCGLAEWKALPEGGGNDGGNTRARTSNLLSSVLSRRAAKMRPEELVQAILRWRGQPMRLEELVNEAAEISGIYDLYPVSMESGSEHLSIGDFLPAPAVPVDATIAWRFDLEYLWGEIALLPPAQRTALLLNLRHEQNGSALELFPLLGIASTREIAEVLGLSLEEMGTFWDRLPLEDLAIAEVLNVSRQQVINLRKSARQRLARRMAVLKGTASRDGNIREALRR